MSKGTYTVRENPNCPERKDTSFRSFICALLVFLTLCIIILLFTIFLQTAKSKPSHKNDAKDDIEVLHMRGNQGTKRKQDKIVLINVPETTRNGNGFTELLPTERSTEKLPVLKNNTNNVPVRKGEQATNPTTIDYFDDEDHTTPTDNYRDVIEKTASSTIDESTEEAVGLGVRTNLLLDNQSTTTEENEITVLSTSQIPEIQTSTRQISENEVTSGSMTRILSILTTSMEEDPITFTTTENIEGNSDYWESTEILTTEENTATTKNVMNKSDGDRIIETTTLNLKDGETDQNEVTESVYEIVEVTNNDDYSAMEAFTIVESTSETTSKAAERTHETVSTSVASVMSSTRPSPPPRVARKAVCRRSICKSEASRMLSSINHAVNPCEDLYEFACGGASRAKSADAAAAAADMLSAHLSGTNKSAGKYVEDFRNFYDSCVAHADAFNYSARIQGVRNLIAEVGQFQFDDAHPDVFDATDLFAGLILRQSMPLLDIGLNVDRQTANYILQLTLPEESALKTGIDTWSALLLHKERCLRHQKAEMGGDHVNLTAMYEAVRRCERDYGRYLDSIQDVLHELGVFGALTATDTLAAIKDIRFDIEFHIFKMFQLMPSMFDVRSGYLNNNYVMMKVADLQIHYPLLSWRKLFAALTGHQVTDDGLVQVYFPKYFKEMFLSLGKLKKRNLNNALLAIFATDLFENTVIPKTASHPEEFCWRRTVDVMPDVATYLIKLSYPQQDYKRQKVLATDLFNSLKTKFTKSLQEAEWLKESEYLILNTLNLISMKICDVDIANDVDLKSNYQKLNVTIDYQNNLIISMINKKRNILSLEGKQFSPNTMFSYFVNPLGRKPVTFFPNDKGIIVVPLGLLRSGSVGLPPYLTLARVGLHLAREIARSFGPVRLHNGTLLAANKAKYNDFIVNTVLMDNHRLLGSQNVSFELQQALSLDERIIENAAFRLLTDTFDDHKGDHLLPWISDDYSQKKIFTIAVAQEYCKEDGLIDYMRKIFESAQLPASLQLENIVTNSEYFVESFVCSEGSGMNMNMNKMQFPFLPLDELPEQEPEEEN